MTLLLSWTTQPAESDALETYNVNGKNNIDRISNNFQAIETQSDINTAAVAILLTNSGVKISVNDTTKSNLETKLIAGENITITKTTGVDEYLTLSSNIESFESYIFCFF